MEGGVLPDCTLSKKQKSLTLKLGEVNATNADAGKRKSNTYVSPALYFDHKLGTLAKVRIISANSIRTPCFAGRTNRHSGLPTMLAFKFLFSVVRVSQIKIICRHIPYSGSRFSDPCSVLLLNRAVTPNFADLFLIGFMRQRN